MDDIIALRCPSCGGQIQVEKNLEKIFCLHCGTQLLMKEGSDGLLIPLMARDSNASDRTQETETSLLTMQTLKEQIKELDAQVRALRVAFWTVVMQGGVKKNYVGHTYKETDAVRRVNQYTQQMVGVSAIVLGRVQLANDDLLDPEKLADSFIIGLTTAGELLAFYQYLIQPQGYDQTAFQLATALYPITSLAPTLLSKRQRYDQAAADLYEEFIRS